MSRKNHLLSHGYVLTERLIVSICLILMFFLPLFMSNTKLFHDDRNDSILSNDALHLSQDDDTTTNDSVIFQGNTSALDITDYGNSYHLNQEISVNNKSETSLEYYLDSQHGWKVSRIENEISNIYDTRNWLNQSDITSPIIYRNYTTFESSHPYQNDGSDPRDYNSTIYEPNANYMRVHFKNITFEEYYDGNRLWDYIYIFNSTGYPHIIEIANRTDFYSPWIPGNTIHIGIESDLGISYYGYEIDWYEYINESSDMNINDKWGFNYDQIYSNGMNYFGSGEIDNVSAIHVDLYSHIVSEPDTFAYEQGKFSEIYQNFTIPRGKVIDAYFEFDYYIEWGMETNENFIYIEVNDEKIYRFGFRDEISSGGRRNWLNTGKIPLNFWMNSTNIFDSTLLNQEFNISLGIESGATVTYSFFEDALTNIVWFDNISFVVTTLANSSQEGIDLKFDRNALNMENQWAMSSIILNEGWSSNPITNDVNTSSPSLSFKLDTILSGYHNTISKIDQLNNPGTIYKIIENGTVYREFYHNLYMPNQYEEFEFIINKPTNWEIISVLDPTLQSRSFERGKVGDSYLKVPKLQAVFPGWWKFVAVSPNYINLTKTRMLKDGIWVNSEFQSGDSTIIKTNISRQSEIPNLENTNASLSIYDPDGKLWYSEKIQPNSTTGLAQFSQIQFSSQNTTGGIYEYNIFWSNGVDVGGVKSSFTINHNSSLTILKPQNLETPTIEGYLGDIIPLRLYLTDSEKDVPISAAEIHYNYTHNESYVFEEVLPGVYDAFINTESFQEPGTYNVSIKTERIGFFTNGMQLQLNLKKRVDNNPFVLPILIGSIGAAGILGALSFRSYVWLPRKRQEEAELMAKTQKFKDLQNIQAVVVIHKMSGIPLYTRGYSILEKQKRELFSGFIQAITTISEEFSGSKLIKDTKAKKQYGIEKLIELDFKYFYCLIADQDDLRVVFILRERASERLKEQVSYLCSALILKLSELFDHWDGSLNEFEIKIPEIVEEYFELYYKGDFELAHPKKIAKSKEKDTLTTMETRVLNVIYSVSKNKQSFRLDYLLEIVHEEKKELIMEALEGLINRKIIVPVITEEDNS